MPRVCCAQGCRNTSVGRDSPCHYFPKDEKLRRTWARAVQPSRPTWMPPSTCLLCSDHFKDSDYETSPALLRSLGVSLKRQRLKPDAVPSVFSGKRKQEGVRGGAFEKGRRKEVTMVDRDAAERAVKEANPIIDGRKANVNLAYLGAKPRANANNGFPLSVRAGGYPTFLPSQYAGLHQPFVYPSAYLHTPSLILPPHPPLSPAAAAFYDYGPSPFGPGAAAAAASANQAAAAAAAAAELGYPFSTSPSSAALAAAAAASYLAPPPPPPTAAHHAGQAAAAAAAAYYTLQQPLGAVTSGAAGSLSTMPYAATQAQDARLQ
ncbi:uncharacterized protein [Dermacentor andersoni]|uniref:uncharacterized protein isoform X2 n=1 Tax=Dermacentor andersoni TaxID=34620 RepID=UPI002416D4F6|nr:RNA-binding protein 24-like isoform X2 [Dermacentor andersoni]